MFDIKSDMEKEGYIFCGEERINSRKRIKYTCPKGHENSIRLDHWKNGHRCSKCSGNKKLTIEYIRAKLLKEGYSLITEKYTNSNTLLNTICPKGHTYKINWNNWSQGYRCSICSNRVKKDLDYISNEVNKEGYTITSDHYKNNREKLTFKCENGHTYEVSWSNWVSKGSRCTVCNSVGTSLQENELFEFVNSICDGVLRFDRDIIKPYELDIVVPSKKVAIEYCGLYWHSELMGKDKSYHINKRSSCEKNGYSLITIFEDELINNKDIVFSRLKSILNHDLLNKIYARKCDIKYISTKDASKFCYENHIQGYSVGTVMNIGAFYNDELVGVMTISKPSISKGNKYIKSGVFELSRFCTKINCRVVGLFSKMLKFFFVNNEVNSMFSYADMRWSVGKLYDSNGFSCVGVTKPNYWYFKKNDKRLHRFALRKQSSEPRDVTEWELRKAQGWNRIWDCGNLKYEYNTQTYKK